MWLFKSRKRKTYTNPLQMEFHQIEPGGFNMGSPKDEPERISGETLHHVSITRPYLLSVHLVSQKLWKRVMGNNPSQFKRDEQCPVENISWDKAVEFCKKLCARDKRNYRLPTEAEWEYACRAATESPFYTGQGITTNDANFNGRMPYPGSPKGSNLKRTSPIGQFSANPWGLFDMHGNVWEWCQDWYDRYSLSDTVDPKGPPRGRLKVCRGGSWQNSARRCRSACRRAEEEAFADFSVGLRVALDVE